MLTNNFQKVFLWGQIIKFQDCLNYAAYRREVGSAVLNSTSQAAGYLLIVVNTTHFGGIVIFAKTFLYVRRFCNENIEEQCASVNFCVDLGKSFTLTFQMKQTVCGHEVLKQSMYSEWFKRSKEGQHSVGYDNRSGWPSTLTEECRLTIRQISEECNIWFIWCQKILTEKQNEPRCSKDRSPTRDGRSKTTSGWNLWTIPQEHHNRWRNVDLQRD